MNRKKYVAPAITVMVINGICMMAVSGGDTTANGKKDDNANYEIGGNGSLFPENGQVLPVQPDRVADEEDLPSSL